MKIGVVSPYLHALGGGERYMLSIASHLAKRNTVHLFWDDEAIKKESFERLAINLDRVTIVRNIFSKEHTVVERVAKSRNYDLLIFLSDGSIPLSLSKHSIIHFQQPFIGIGGKSILNKIKFTRIDTVICNSQFTKQYIDEEFGIDSTVLYPPVNTKQFVEREKKQIILSVGRFQYVKRQDILIESFKKMKLGKGWKLVLIGGLLEQDRDYFKKLQQLSNNAPIELHPNEPFKQLQEAYSHAKIYWHGTGYSADVNENPALFEHFGITPIEAMAAGCIPVLYNGGGLVDLITHEKNGYLWNTPKDLISITKFVIDNNQYAMNIKSEAIKRSKEFDNKIFNTKIDQLIASICH